MNRWMVMVGMGWLAMGMESSASLSSKAVFHVFRLKPGADLMQEIQNWAKQNRIKAASVVTTVGSLKRLNLRYANQPEGTSHEAKFEITSLVGTLTESGAHLHLQVSNEKGEAIGGHLLPGNLVYTTAEVVVAELPELVFSREQDPASGFSELVIRRK